MESSKMETQNPVVVNEDFCFPQNEKITSDISCRGLKIYSNEFETAIRLEGDLPIFLDTNILLGYYGMSQSEKGNLLKYLHEQAFRIVITRQVEKEFLRNRIGVISKEFFDPLEKAVSGFHSLQKEIEGKLKNYLDNNKSLFSKDYPAVWKRLGEIEKKIHEVTKDSALYQDIKKEIGKTTKDNKNIVVNDPMLELVSSLKILDELSELEITFLVDRFNRLHKEFMEARDGHKEKLVIPGCGDKKDDASGDFIIFNEMLKYMKENSTSAIFLTKDVTKGDWLKTDMTPNIHYLENAFLLTRNMIFIANAEKSLSSISFQNIHTGQLEITSAIYGTGTVEKQFDITQILNSSIEQNKLTVSASNNLAGDPDPGVVKKLKITYKVGDKPVTVEVEEGKTITLPEDYA